MKKVYPLALLALLPLLNGCAVIGGIFKAGVWVGVLIVVVIIAIIIWVISKASK
jgi:hypothetical protein